jgi:hypothetical protein
MSAMRSISSIISSAAALILRWGVIIRGSGKLLTNGQGGRRECLPPFFYRLRGRCGHLPLTVIIDEGKDFSLLFMKANYLREGILTASGEVPNWMRSPRP